MTAFREERNRMQSKRTVRWLASVAALAAATLGSGVTLATSASAATESVTVTPVQPRYPVTHTATFHVNVTSFSATPHLALSVTGEDHGAPDASCTAVSGSGAATCSFTNFNGTGPDQVVVTDTANSVASNPTTVSFETLAATAGQSVQLSPSGTAYLYGAGTTASVLVTVTGGGATTPSLKGLVTSGPDVNTLLSCSRSATQPANWTCTLTNHGSAGADTIQVFDDDQPNGTTNQADTDEAPAPPVTINFEKLTATPTPPRTQSQANALGNLAVTLTHVPTGWVPVLKEQLGTATDSAAGSCTSFTQTTTNSDGTRNGTATCTVINDGRTDAATVTIYDDLNNNSAPDATEPVSPATVYFESIDASLDQSANQQTGVTITITATASGVPDGQTPKLDYQVEGAQAPDKAGASPVAFPCSAGNPATCTITNNGTSGTDSIRVFDDTNNDGAWNTNEPSKTVTANFGDALTATPRNSGIFATKDANNPGSGHGLIDVTVSLASGETAAVRYVVGGTAPSAPDSGQAGACQAGSAGNWVCDVLNNGNPGTDPVTIYNDNDGSGTLNTGDATTGEAPLNITFSDPSAIDLQPKLAPNQSQAMVATGGCQVYTLTVSPYAQYPVKVVITENLGTSSSAPPAALAACNVPGGSTYTVSHPTTNPSGGSAGFPPIIPATPWTDELDIAGATNQDPAHPGQFIFGISSSQAGTVTLTPSTNLATHSKDKTGSPQNLAVVAPGTPHSVSVTPTNPTISQNGTQTFTALVQDASGTPVPGAKVSYVVAAGDPDATSSAVGCQAGDQFGQSKCSIINNGKTGTDHVTFFSPLASNETAPAANDPQTTTTLTIQAAPPAGSTLTFGCPDELATDANQIVPSCTVTTGDGSARSVFFAAHVAGPSGAALTGVPVTFAMTASPSGTTTSATQVATNAKGNALFVVTVPHPAAGNKVTVTATIGDPAHGGLGPKSATATFQSPHPASVSLTPASQHVAAGGFVTVTAKVADQFGVGVAGQTISYSVSGRNSQSGTATTGSGGTAAITYVDAGTSGSDVVTALDTSSNAPSGTGSNNPATASVLYGSSGCQTNCGGTGKKEAPKIAATQTALSGGRSKIKLTVTSHPKLVQATVVFYQVSKDGTRHKIGTAVTDRHGKARGTLKAANGLRLRFQAKVKGRAGVKSGYSNVVKVHVGS